MMHEALQAASQPPGVIMLRVSALGIYTKHAGRWPERDALFADLDANGMLEPIQVHRATWPERLRIARLHSGDPGEPMTDLIVKRGCQRVAYAKARGYDWIDAVVYADEGALEDARADLLAP